MKVPCTRPDDFFAEMLRTDKIMFKVKEKITEEQRRLSVVQERKRRQANKKFSKQTHVERVKARALDKAKTMQNIKDWRKDGKKRDRDEELENILDGKGFEKKQRIDEGGGMPRKEKKEDSRASTRSSRAKRAA